jgi:N-acetylmuramoyl-L-alanine amidase
MHVLRSAWILALSSALVATAGAADLWLGGDVHLGVTSPSGFVDVLGGIEGVGVVNLEGPVGSLPWRRRGDELLLGNHPASLGLLARAGVAVVGIANNHARDAGTEGASRTAAAIGAAGLRPAGGPAGVARLELDGVRVAVTAHDLSAGVPEGLAETLARAAGASDVLVATFHTYTTGVYLPGPVLREAASIAHRAGAEVVAAHGSHELGPVEVRPGRVTLWGLGNLAFACPCTSSEEALVARLTVGVEGLEQVELIPVRAAVGGAPLRLHESPATVHELLRSLGSVGLERHGDRLVAEVPPAPESSLDGRVVCLDPGHPSETSAGTEGPGGVTENHLNWVIGGQLAAALRARGATVVLTKEREDEMVTNRRRAEIGNEAGADILLRLHCDAGAKGGFQLFYPDRPGTRFGVTGPPPEVRDASKVAAEQVVAGMAEVLEGHHPNKGIAGDSATYIGGKQGALTGSIFSEVPALLVEMGTLTLAEDERFLDSQEGQRLLVEAMTRGLERYFSRPDR